MWFDCVVIDRLLEDGILDSFHIRAVNDRPFPVDRLEDIDPNFRSVDASDVGPLRVYNWVNMNVSRLQLRLKNFEASSEEIRFQLDHFHIPVIRGYYAVVFPRTWRVRQIKIYDPYDRPKNVAEKRSYMDVKLCWDSQCSYSYAQLELRSRPSRGSFSLGVIASLSPSDRKNGFLEDEAPMTVLFPDHQGHPAASAYRQEVDQIMGKIVQEESQKMPGINVGLSGPSINIVEWARYIRSKIRTPK